MTLWKLTLAYDGTPFHGWQIQPRLPTVQGTLSDALHRLTGERVLPQGSGRTDAGVHALAQVASLSLAAPIPPANLLRALNRSLPASIRILSAEHAPAYPDGPFHARHSALRKTYEYRIFPRTPTETKAPVIPTSPVTTTSPVILSEAKNPSISLPSEQPPGPPCLASETCDPYPHPVCPPFLAPYVWDCPFPFSLRAAQQAATHILGTHDFTSFAASDPDLSTRTTEEPRSNVRTIFTSQWSEADGLFLYRITGSGFLHHMVRNLVGTFVDIAAGRIPSESIPTILAARNRSAAGPTAPARGLFLVSVDYPDPGAPCLDSETSDRTSTGPISR